MMAFQELIKNFERTREYIRDFYVYGYKSRSDFHQKSGRTYDDERRRIESWLASYVQFHYTADGKQLYLSINSREQQANPLFRIWKTRSFTAGDITLHFILFDILASGEAYTVQQLMDYMDNAYLSQFEDQKTFDSSTVRKKLKEYEMQGMLVSEKQGKTIVYRKREDNIPLLPLIDALQYYSEILPCGVVGSFLLDRCEKGTNPYSIAFKHHYITHVIDSGILYDLLDAMHKRNAVTIEIHTKNQSEALRKTVIPLQILISAQNGRQYLLAYDSRKQRVYTHRMDYITNVKTEELVQDYMEQREKVNTLKTHMWGVSTGRNGKVTEYVEFTVQYEPDEFYIYQRMLREKRCGIVEKLDERHCRFSAEVFDTVELLPWIRTFLCRITDIHFSNQEAEALFRNDVKQMYQLYGLEDTV